MEQENKKKENKQNREDEIEQKQLPQKNLSLSAPDIFALYDPNKLKLAHKLSL